MISRIFRPKDTARRSKASEATCAAGADAPQSVRACFSVASSMPWYWGIWAAAVISDGLVVASRGLKVSIAWMSPVSATTTVISRNC